MFFAKFFWAMDDEPTKTKKITSKQRKFEVEIVINMNDTNILIAHPKDETQTNVLKAVMEALNIKFEEEKPYNKDFVEKIKNSKLQYENGQFTTIKKTQIKEFLGL
jgi:DNA-dependent RNA polymerase auxiliary subunit epsilon